MPWSNRISGVPNQSFTFLTSNSKSLLGPLFISESGAPLTWAHFKSLLSATLKKAGLDDSKFNTHIFSIGTAISAKAVGILDVYIQLLGQWKSSAFQGYIHQDTHSCPHRIVKAAGGLL